MLIPEIQSRFESLGATHGAIPNQLCFDALRQYSDEQNFTSEEEFNAALERLAYDDMQEWAIFGPIFFRFMQRMPSVLDKLVIKQIISGL